MMDTIPNWLILAWAGGMLGLLYNISRQASDILDHLRGRNSN
jgi:hypothetical protein